MCSPRRRNARTRGRNAFRPTRNGFLRDGTFDLVLGHAVLHHLPDLETALAEFRACSRPEGRWRSWASRHGTATRSRACRSGSVPLARRCGGGSCEPEPNGCEGMDETPLRPRNRHRARAPCRRARLHPRDLHALSTRAGFVDVRVSGEELLANAYGWFLRALEATSIPGASREHGTGSRFAAISRCSGSTGGCSSPASRRPLLQPAAVGARKPA